MEGIVESDHQVLRSIACLSLYVLRWGSDHVGTPWAVIDPFRRSLRNAWLVEVIRPPERHRGHDRKGAVMTQRKRHDDGVTRLSFLKSSAGVAAGAAMIAVPGAVAQAAEEKGGVPVTPSSANPREPVMAYVRDAARGEVTVMSGTHEKTYRDRALAKRLMAAAPENSAAKGGER
jgi:hypothetical protein